jgi:hypothetical protein
MVSSVENLSQIKRIKFVYKYKLQEHLILQCGASGMVILFYIMSFRNIIFMVLCREENGLLICADPYIVY